MLRCKPEVNRFRKLWSANDPLFVRLTNRCMTGPPISKVLWQFADGADLLLTTQNMKFYVSTLWSINKLICRREAARRSLSFEILLSPSRSFDITR